MVRNLHFHKYELTVSFGTTASPTVTVSVVMISKLRTSVIFIGHRSISTERGVNTACKACASVVMRAVQGKCHRSHMAHIRRAAAQLCYDAAQRFAGATSAEIAELSIRQGLNLVLRDEFSTEWS